MQCKRSVVTLPDKAIFCGREGGKCTGKPSLYSSSLSLYIFMRLGSTPVSIILRKSVRVFIRFLMKKKIKIWPISWMTQKPQKGDVRELLKIKKKLHGWHVPGHPKSLGLRCSFRKWASIYHRSAAHGLSHFQSLEDPKGV